MTYKHIRSLARGIDVLKYLNTVNGAHAVEICRHLNLPRPTVHRILETLEEFNLVYQGPFSREFRVTPDVRRLAGTQPDFSALRQAAWPEMCQLTRRVVWPSDLAVYRDDAMLIVESTHRLSPLSVDIGMIGVTRRMLDSPLGRAFLSQCSAEQRAAAIEALRKGECADADRPGTLEAIDQIVADGRRDGYSICPDLPHTRCASMAAAVRDGGEAVAVINIVWNVGDMSYEDARAHLSGPLLAARDRIEAALQERLPVQMFHGEAPGLIALAA